MFFAICVVVGVFCVVLVCSSFQEDSFIVWVRFLKERHGGFFSLFLRGV